MSLAERHVLVLDEDETSRRISLSLLRNAHARADGVGFPSAAIELLRSVPYELVVADWNCPVLSGPLLSTALGSLGNSFVTPALVLLLPVTEDIGSIAARARLPSDCFLRKPINPLSFIGACERALTHMHASKIIG